MTSQQETIDRLNRAIAAQKRSQASAKKAARARRTAEGELESEEARRSSS